MIQLCVIIGYLVLLLMLGLSANRFFRGTATDYMLASHSIGPVLLLMSLFGTTMTAFALVGSTGQAYRAGIGVYGELASASGIIHSLCFFVIGLPLWALGRRHGYTTQIQFFRDRLQSDFLGLLLFPILVLLVISYLLVGIVGGGAVVESITADAFKFGESGWFASSGYGVPSWIASAVICGVVLLLHGRKRCPCLAGISCHLWSRLAVRVLWRHARYRLGQHLSNCCLHGTGAGHLRDRRQCNGGQ